MVNRDQQLRAWLASRFPGRDFDLVPASEDASFRRYLRVTVDGEWYIVMDAPPAKEDSGPWVRIAGLLADLGLNVPRVLAADPARGFLLITDLGERLYLDALTDDTAEQLYGDALEALVVMQAGVPPDADLPLYDRRLLLAEMGLFRDWLVEAHLGIALDQTRRELLEDAFARLADAALAQPRVFVHRDYHSRNLMVTDANNPGILDFQDAVRGPVTYDLVSLLRDCYVAWPPERVEGWALGWRERAVAAGVPAPDTAAFLRDFDWMGVQRHLKAAGIFARLNRRDGKPGFLADIPRTLGYVVDVAAGYPELRGLAAFVADEVLPSLASGAQKV